MMTVAAVSALAQGWVMVQPGDWDPASGHGPDWGKAAPAGLLIWLFMGVALFLLIKSMNRHLRRVPKTFDTNGDGSAGAAESASSASDGGDGGAGGVEEGTGIAGDDDDSATDGEARDGEAAEEPVAATPPQSKDPR